jgi:cytochrome c oxidase assembly factor CtaG
VTTSVSTPRQPVRHEADPDPDPDAKGSLRPWTVVTIWAVLLGLLAADSGTGVAYALQSREVFAPYARVARDWGPGLVTDLHAGGYIMFTGSDAVMSIIAIVLAARLLRSASGGRLPSGSRRHADAESDAPLSAYNE